MIDKIHYITFKIRIKLLEFYIEVLIIFSALIRKKRKKQQLHLYPFAQKGSDGYTRRFEEFIAFLERDGINFKLHDICTDEEYQIAFSDKKSNYYNFLLRVLRIRIKQTLDIRNAQKAFVHRNLFPFYYDQKKPRLEKLASKLCDEVVYDYWDSVWVYNEVLNNRTIKFANTISVANKYLFDHYSRSHSNVKYFNIGVNLDKYIPKNDYSLTDKSLRIFYTGRPSNVSHMLNEIGPFLLNSLNSIRLKLVIVSAEKPNYPGLEIIHFKFNEETFFELLNSCDAGIYALKDSVATRGKMAMKVLDYAATGLPIIATRYGVSPHLNHGENVFFCDDENDWKTYLKLLFDNKNEREKIGKNARLMAEKFHTLEKTYQQFKDLFKSI